MAEQRINDKLRRYNHLSREYNDLYRGFGRGYGLADCAVWILYVIRESADKIYTQHEICKRLYQSKQTINSSLKKLEEAGLLELRYAANNRKEKEIFLTPEGVALAEKTADKVMEAEQKALAGLTESEQDVFLELFGKYIGALRTELGRFRSLEEENEPEK